MDVWNSIIEGLHRNSKSKEIITTVKEYQKLQERHLDLTSDDKKLIEADLRAKRELRFGLTPSSLRLIEPCQTVHQIWIKLQESYGSNELLDSIQSSLLVEYGAFTSY